LSARPLEHAEVVAEGQRATGLLGGLLASILPGVC